MEKEVKITRSLDRVPWNLRFAPDKEARYRDFWYRTNIVFLRLSFIALAVTTSVFGLIAIYGSSYQSNYERQIAILFVLIILPIAGVAVTYLPVFRRLHSLILTTLTAATTCGVILRVLALPTEVQSHAYAGLLFMLLANFGLMRQRFLSAICNGLIITAIYLATARIAGILSAQLWNQIAAYFLLFNLGGASIAYLIDWSQRRTFLAKELLESEHERAENLLRNILPLAIADRLKTSQTCIADHVPEVTVLFADIVGFTERARLITPESLVTMLDQIFSDFDAIMERHNIEKIKTIGDSYMAASGLLESTDNHCARIADAALDIMEYTKNYGGGLQLRIGLHTGPVVAGVIGRKKMIYDLWGDTVNIASRMESHSADGFIQVSEAVYSALEETYDLGSLRTIAVKGQGNMRAAYLIGRKKKLLLTG